MQEDLYITIPYEWTWLFTEKRLGLWDKKEVNITLAPYDWAFRQVATTESFSYKSQNLTRDSKFTLQVIDRPLKYLRVQETCQPNDTAVLKTYGGLVNCSRCAEPSTKVGEGVMQ